MIETADIDYAADYDTVYERPIMSRYFDQKFKKILFPARIFDNLFFSPRPQIMTFFQLFTFKFQLYPGKNFS